MASSPQSLGNITGISTIVSEEAFSKAISEPSRITTATGSAALACLQVYAGNLEGSAIATFATLCDLKNIFSSVDKSNHLVKLIENAKAVLNTLEIFQKENKAKIEEISSHVSRIKENISETSKILHRLSILKMPTYLSEQELSDLNRHKQRLSEGYTKVILIYESTMKNLMSSEENFKKVEASLTDSIRHATVLQAKVKLIEEQFKKTEKPGLEIEDIIQLSKIIMENSKSNLKRIELALQVHESLKENNNEARLHLETTEKLESVFSAKLKKSFSEEISHIIESSLPDQAPLFLFRDQPFFSINQP